LSVNKLSKKEDMACAFGDWHDMLRVLYISPRKKSFVPASAAGIFLHSSHFP